MKYELLAIDNIPRVSWATGGLLQKSPIVCGGCDGEYKFSQDGVVIGQPEKQIKMLEKRRSAASVVLDQKTLWVVGGQQDIRDIQFRDDRYAYDLSSTEFIKMDQISVKGPDLPFCIKEHSMIHYEEKSIFNLRLFL